MKTAEIELNEDEEALLAQIKLDASALADHHDARQNGEAVCSLMKLLISRSAIPEHRVGAELIVVHTRT